MTDLALDTLLDALAEKLADRVAARLSNGNGHAASVDDTLLDAKEAAKRLGVKVRWIYGHAKRLGFAVKLPGRAVRFSALGLQKYIERKRG